MTDKEMMDWYKKNPEIRTSHILIQFKPGANEEEKKIAKNRAKEILSSVIKSKRPFEELVALYSDDTLSKSAGGDVGWQSRVTLVPTYYDAALRLKKGAISELIETQFGFHIVKLVGQRGFADANRQQIRMAVFEEKRKELFDGYFAKLLKKYSVKKNTSLLK
ncbi:MAG: peptidylprolyl isomerase [Pseudomonadota bacterium]|nr:peptidylprolyl isomerase [Pseudomonadota bacterium]